MNLGKRIHGIGVRMREILIVQGGCLINSENKNDIIGGG
jgi:hypothetical protein